MKYLLSEQDLKISGDTALYFYASWMPFHKKMVTMIGKIEEKFKYNFIGIDVDNFKSLCKIHNITSVPTVLAFKGDKEVKRIIGITLTSAFKSAFVDICNS